MKTCICTSITYVHICTHVRSSKTIKYSYVAIRIFPYDVNKPTENGEMCKLYLVQLNA